MKDITQVNFVVFQKLDTLKKSILIAGQHKRIIIKKAEHEMIQKFKPRVIVCADSKELEKITKEYIKFFREVFPELYI